MRRFLPLLCTVLALASYAGETTAHDIQAASHAWRPTLIREARAIWGIDAPTALFAAQIEQESAWRSDARSPYADGMAQFTAATAKDMSLWYPELGPVDVFNPRWAIRAMVRYDHRLYGRIIDTASDCDRWAMTLASYNGGPGWLVRDRNLCRQTAGCDPARWWGHTEHVTRRAAWARIENRAYPARILHRAQPRYIAALWPGRPVCS